MNFNYQTDAREKTTRLLFFLGILIFTYTLLRAGLLSITWDESQSYHEYIRNRMVLIDRYDFMSANNHILNTLGGILFTELFGVTEFTLRMPALIAHALFLIFSAKLVLSFDRRWLTVSAFLILNTNPFLLDFFSLSRGYGISLGLMMVSIYYLFLVHRDGQKKKDLLLTVVFSALATLGNLTLLNYCVVSFGVMSLLVLAEHYHLCGSWGASLKPTINKLLFPALFLIVFLAFILPISFDLRAVGALFMGGDQGLWKDTLGTIVPRLLYDFGDSFLLQRITKGFILLIIFSASAFLIFKIRKREFSKSMLFFSSLLLIFLLILLSTVVQHHLLGTLYLIERTVLFLFVLLMLILVFFLNEFSFGTERRGWILHGIAGVFVVLFLCSMNLKYVYEWKDDCETKDMLKDLVLLREERNEKFNISIGIPLTLESSINYYRSASELTWLNESMRDKRINFKHDYFFLRPVDTIGVDMDSLKVLKRYPITGNLLAQPNYPPGRWLVIQDNVHGISNGNPTFKVDETMEFSPGYSFIINDWSPIQNSLLTCQIEFEPTERFTANVYFVLSCIDKTGMYQWKNLRLNDFCYDKKGSTIANFTTFIPEEMKTGDELKVYLWNPDKQQFLIHKMRLKWIHYF